MKNDSEKLKHVRNYLNDPQRFVLTEGKEGSTPRTDAATKVLQSESKKPVETHILENHPSEEVQTDVRVCRDSRRDKVSFYFVYSMCFFLWFIPSLSLIEWKGVVRTYIIN